MADKSAKARERAVEYLEEEEEVLDTNLLDISESRAAGPVTLTYWPAANPPEVKLATLLADHWNREHPDVRVRVQPLPAGRSTEEVLLAAIVATLTLVPPTGRSLPQSLVGQSPMDQSRLFTHTSLVYSSSSLRRCSDVLGFAGSNSIFCRLGKKQHFTLRWLIARFKKSWGFEEPADVASLPLLLLLAGLVPLLIEPIGNAYSRHVEHEADRFGLEITQNNHAAATAFVKLQQDNLANPRPGPLYVLWRANHPPLAARIEFCNEYRPWATGQTLRYGMLFRRDAPSQ